MRRSAGLRIAIAAASAAGQWRSCHHDGAAVAEADGAAAAAQAGRARLPAVGGRHLLLELNPAEK